MLPLLLHIVWALGCGQHCCVWSISSQPNRLEMRLALCAFALISAIGFSRERARGGIQCSRFGSVCCCVLKNWSKSNNMCSRFSWELFENYLSVRKFRFKCSSFATYRVLTASSSATFTRARTHWLICDFISHSHSRTLDMWAMLLRYIRMHHHSFSIVIMQWHIIDIASLMTSNEKSISISKASIIYVALSLVRMENLNTLLACVVGFKQLRGATTSKHSEVDWKLLEKSYRGESKQRAESSSSVA